MQAIRTLCILIVGISLALGTGCNKSAPPESNGPTSTNSAATPAKPTAPAPVILPRFIAPIGDLLGMTRIALAPDSKSLVLDGGSKVTTDVPREKQQNVQVWDLEKKSMMFGIASTGHGPVAFSPDGKTIAYSVRWASPYTKDGIYLVNASTNSELKQLKLKDDDTGIELGIEFTPSSDLLVSAYQKPAGATRLLGWDTKTGELRLDWKIHDKDGSAVSRFFKKGQRNASGEGPFVKIWNVPEKKLERELRYPEDAKVESIAASEDGKFVAANGGKDICLWDNETGKLLRRIDTRAGTLKSPSDDAQILFTPNGKTIIYTKQDRRIFVEDVATGELRAVLGWRTTDKPEKSSYGLLERIFGIEISRDGHTLVAAHNTEFGVWDLPDNL